LEGGPVGSPFFMPVYAFEVLVFNRLLCT